MVIVFQDDDSNYLEWINNYVHGYVINTRRKIDEEYMVLHRASCSSIKNYNLMAKSGGFTERNYIKICSTNIDDLREWVKVHGREDGKFSSECSRCYPL